MLIFSKEKAYQEIKRVFVDDNCPSIQELNNMKYMECVIKETLRVFPPVPMIGRMIHEPVDLPSRLIYGILYFFTLCLGKSNIKLYNYMSNWEWLDLLLRLGFEPTTSYL